jgi:exodeoxyribonuclease V gamma subunit
VRLLALAASGYPVTEVVTLGRGGSGNNPGVSRSMITVPDDPAALLAQLLELRDAGLRYPLPIATESSFAYAEQRLADPPGDGYRAASKKWWDPTVTWRRDDEKDDEALVCVYGPDAPFSDVWDQPAPARFQWFDEPNWFAQLAVRLWEPILGCTR